MAFIFFCQFVFCELSNRYFTIQRRYVKSCLPGSEVSTLSSLPVQPGFYSWHWHRSFVLFLQFLPTDTPQSVPTGEIIDKLL